jgi:hypothetical protein
MAEDKVECKTSIKCTRWEFLRYFVSGEWPSYRRLVAAIPDFEAELELVYEARCSEPVRQVSSWKHEADCLLNKARGVAARDLQLAWRSFTAARRMLIIGYSPDLLKLKATSLLLEAEDKLWDSGWRKKSIREYLADRIEGQAFKEPLRTKTDLDKWNVFEAAKILDDHFENQHTKVRNVRRRVTWFSLLGIVSELLLVFLSKQFGLFGNLSGSPSPPLTTLSVALFGIMGATVSGFTSTKGLDPARLPFQTAAWFVTMGRFVVGSLAAIFVAVSISAGISKIAAPDYSVVLAAAFASGFSDRLLVSALAAVDK